MTLSIKRLRSEAKLPVCATPDSAGYDLYACLEAPLEIKPGEIRKVSTGIAMAPDRRDVAMYIFARSGLASKYGITLANSVGLVDSDYRGEILVPLINLGTVPFIVEPGTRIAQLVVMPVLKPQLIETETLDETIRGTGGFGASGLT